MPNRILREGINDSEAVNKLSESSELFYRRLMSIVDDYGRFEASPKVIRGRVFSLRYDEWPEERIQKALLECSRVLVSSNGLPLVSLYSVAGKQYLQINNFGQRLRSKSKCPDMPADNCAQDAQLAESALPATSSANSPTRATNSNTHTDSHSNVVSSEGGAGGDSPPGAVASPIEPAGSLGDEVGYRQRCDGLRALWAAGGRPFTFRDETALEDLFRLRPDPVQIKICEHAAWAFGPQGWWTSPAKTKGFRDYVESGAGENGAPTRTLPTAPNRGSPGTPSREEVRKTQLLEALNRVNPDGRRSA